MTFEEYQKAMEKTPLAEAEKETVQKFQDAMRSVNLRLIRINRDQVGSEIGRYAGSAGFLITDPERITGDAGKKAWQLDADKLDGLHNYLLAEDNFEKIMQVGTDGENAPFGADGKLFFDVLAILQKIGIRIDVNEWKKHYDDMQKGLDWKKDAVWHEEPEKPAEQKLQENQEGPVEQNLQENQEGPEKQDGPQNEVQEGGPEAGAQQGKVQEKPLEGFAAEYKAISEEYLAFLHNPAPDAGSQPAEYVAYADAQNMALQKLIYAQHVLRDMGMPLAQLRQAMVKAYGQEEAEKRLAEAEQSGIFVDYLETYMKEHPELLNGLSDDEKKLFSGKRDVKAIEIAKRLVQEGKLSDREYERIFVSMAIQNYLGVSNEALINQPLVNALSDTLTPEQAKAAKEALDAWKNPMEYPPEEQVTYPRAQQVEQLKNAIPEAIKQDPEKLKQYQDALDYAAKHLTLVKVEVQDATFIHGKNVGSVESGYTKQIANTKATLYQNGKYHDLFLEKGARGNQISVVKQEKRQAYQELFQDKIHLSEQTKNGMKRMIAKMEEMKLLDYGYDPKGEEADKVYGLNKLQAHKLALEAALDAGDPDQIIAAKTQYEQTCKDMEELYRIAKESFSTDPNLFPGNVDGSRNASLPWEFTGDIMTNSQVNAVFLIYMRLKMDGRTLEEYLENPTKGLVESTLEAAKPFTLAEASKGKNLKDCLDIWLGAGKFKHTQEQLMLAAPLYGISRNLMGPGLLERDPEVRDGDIVYCETLGNSLQKSMQTEINKIYYLQNKTHNEIERQERQQSLENLILVADEDRNLNALMGGIPEADIFGRIINPPFDAAKYVAEHPADYEAILNRAEIMMDKARENAGEYLRVEEVLEAEQSAFAKVLVAHRAERGTPGYDRLEQTYLDLVDRLPDDAEPARVQRMQQARNEYLKELARTAPENGMQLMERRMEDAQRGVHGGSGEFDKAQENFGKLRNSIMQLMNRKKAGEEEDTTEEQRELIDKLKNQLVETRAAIRDYFARKQRQGMYADGKATAQADAKATKRIRTLTETSAMLDGVQAWVEQAQIDLNKELNEPDIDEIQKMALTQQETENLFGLHLKFNTQDREWYARETGRISAETGYSLDRRASGDDALRLYLITKGATIEELVQMESISPEEYKAKLQEFFDHIDYTETPEGTRRARTKEEKIQTIAQMHRQAVAKISSWQVPLPEDMNTVAGMAQAQKTMRLIQALQIDLTQDAEAYTGSTADPWMRKVYYDALGDVAEYENQLSHLSALSQGYYRLPEQIFKSKHQMLEKAFAMDVARERLNELKGKTIAEVPTWNFGEMNKIAAFIGEEITSSDSIEYTNMDLWNCLDYLNGKRQDYIGQKELREKWVKEYQQLRKDMNERALQDAHALSGVFMGQYSAHLTDPAAENLLTALSEEDQTALEEAYRKHFGKLYRGITLAMMTDFWGDDFDLITLSDGRSIRELVEKQYPDNLTPQQKERAMRLEAMRHAITEGVICSYAQVRTNGTVVRSEDFPVKSVAERFGLWVNRDNITAAPAAAENFLKNPAADEGQRIRTIGDALQDSLRGYMAPAQELLADNGLTLMDCVFIGDRTLNELYEEKYRDLAPDADKEKLMFSVLAAESFHAETPIFVNYVTEAEDELQNHPVPLTFHGTSFDYPEHMPLRELKLTETKAYAEKVLAEREEKLADPEAERDALLNRAMVSMESAAAREHAFGTDYPARIHTLQRRAKLFAPAYRVLLQQTLEKVQTPEMDQALFQYRLYDRASKLAVNPTLKEEYAQKAQELRDNPPIADYEKYLIGLEHAYMIRPVQDTPVEIHAFFEEKTGSCVPRFMEQTIQKSVYRPTELTVGMADAEESLRALMDEVYKTGKFQPKDVEDRNELILLGGRTLKDIMQEMNPRGYAPNADGSDILAKQMAKGWPIDFFVAGNKPNRDGICSVPVHILPTGKHESDLDPELVALQHRCYYSVLGKAVLSDKEAEEIVETLPERKVLHQSEEELQARERKLTERAEKDYENFRATEPYLTRLHGPSLYMSAFQKRFIVGAYPTLNNAALDARQDLSQDEKELRRGGLRPDPGRTSAGSYIISRLAWESKEREKNGLDGYTLEQIVSLNELEEQKRKYAQEFKELCEKYDTDTYCENLLNGAKALMEMHAKRYPAQEIFTSEEKMREAFLGKVSGTVSYVLFDNKQELEHSVPLQVSKGLFATEAEADLYITRLADYGSVGNMIAAKDVYERGVAAGEEDIQQGIGTPYAYEVMMDGIHERLAQGLEPYEGCQKFYYDYGVGGPLADEDVLSSIPALSNAVHKRTADSREKLVNGTFFDTYVIDLDKLMDLVDDEASLDEISACVQEVTPEQKAKLKEVRLDAIEKNALDYRMSQTEEARRRLLTDVETGQIRKPEDLQELSDEELEEASALYHKIFDPVMERPGVKEYLKEHPDKNVYDLFRVGSIPLKEYLGGEVDAFMGYQDGEKVLQEMILLLATNPGIPFGYVTIRPDPVTGAYVEAGQEQIFDAAERNRIVSERPELTSLASYRNWYKRSYPALSTERYTDEDWKALYEIEFRKTSDSGLIAADRVISLKELEAKGDQVHYQSGIFARVESIYGAKPMYVSEYTGNTDGSFEGRVYSRDEFKQHMKELNAGSFANGEFATLAYFTALNPVVVDDPVQSAHLSEEAVPHDMKVRAGSHFWTVDFNQTGQPRANLGKTAFAGKIAPARETAEKLIAEYDKGNVQPMADMIAFGIRDICLTAKTQASYTDTKCTAAHIGYMLKNLTTLMEEREDLMEAVKDQLQDDELELLQVMVKMYEMAEHREEALQKLTAAENGTPLSDKDRERYIAQIAAFDHYAQLWSDNRKAYENSEIYQNFVEENMTKMVAKETTPEDRMALEHYAEDFDRVAQDMAPGLAEEILDNERQYAFGEAAVEDLAALRAFYQKHVALYREADAAYHAEKNAQGQYVVTSEQALATQQKKAEAEYRLDKMTQLLVQGMTEAQGKRVFERYNAQAAQKGSELLRWDAKSGMKNLEYAGSRTIMNNAAPDLYYDLLFDEAAKGAVHIKGAGEKLKQLKLPTEWTLEERSDYPLKDKIEALKHSFRTRRKEEREAAEKEGKPFAEDELIPVEEVEAMLDTVNSHLSVRKDAFQKFIHDHEDRIHVSAVLEYHTMHSMNEYHGAGYEDMGEFHVYGGIITTMVIKPEKEQMVDQLLQDPPEISEDVAVNAAGIIHRMEEYGFITGQSIAEQGTKVYGYEKLLAAKKELQKAVEDGDLEKIAEANEAYEKVHAQVQEIHDMIRKAFPGETFVPGNVDTIRTFGKDAIPVEFSGDYLTDSKFNGLFQVGEYAKRLGVSIEDYLKNPGKCMYESFQKIIAEKGVESITKDHKNFMESFNDLMEKEEEGLSNNFMKATTGGEVGLAVGRGLQGVFLLESDPHKREEMMRYQQHVIQLVNVLINKEVNEMKFYNDAFTQIAFGRNMEPELVARMKNGLKAAFLEGGPITKKHLPYVHTDEKGVRISDPLNYQGLLSQKDQYANLTKQYTEILADAKNCEYSMVKTLIQEAMLDYLMAHPEDRERKEYKDLEQLALGAVKDLEISAGEASVNENRYHKWQTAIEAEQKSLAQRELDDDNLFRKEYMAKQAKLTKLIKLESKKSRSSGSLKPIEESKEVRELKEELREMIDERMQQLADGYRAKEVTETYLVARYEQLTALRDDLTKNIKKESLPEFVSTVDPEQRKADLQMINERVQNRAYEGHLKSLEAYISFRLEQEPNLERGDLSNEEWREAYNSAIRTDAAQYRNLTPLPGQVRDSVRSVGLPNMENDLGAEADLDPDALQNREQDVRQSVRQSNAEVDNRGRHTEFYQEIAEHLEEDVKERQVHLSGIELSRDMKISILERTLTDNIADIKDPEVGKDVEEKLLKAIAHPVALELIQSRGGVVPAGMGEVGFVKKMAQDKSFKAVVKPLLEEIHEEWSKTKNPEAELASAKHLVKLVEDGTILHAFGLETKAQKKGMPGAGVKHAKTLAQTQAEEHKRKVAEEARKQKAAEEAKRQTGAPEAKKQNDKQPVLKGPGNH
ncbi:MAG: hypothetical protein IJ147_02515 [Lachnospiraceae bacterium]|nr:hypothetical protein [Lachnospiraceae bacterium]